MIVYCGDENCIHNNDGICECRWDTGQEAISLIETLGGQIICSDQKDREERRVENGSGKSI